MNNILSFPGSTPPMPFAMTGAMDRKVFEQVWQGSRFGFDLPC